MAKRMTATEKWDDPFFFDLSPENKLIWIYLLDKCNHAGVIEFSERLASFATGLELKSANILQVFKSRIEVLESGKWFIKKFIDFQYGELSDTNRTHVSVKNILIKEGVIKPLTSPLQGGKDTITDKDKDKDNENLPIFSVEHCIAVAMNDDTWVQDNKVTVKELEVFVKFLRATGVTEKNPKDFKSHFYFWKRKEPPELKKKFEQKEKLTSAPLSQLINGDYKPL